LLAQRAGSDEHKLQRALDERAGARDRLDGLVRPFDRDEARDLGDGNHVVGEAELVAQFVAPRVELIRAASELCDVDGVGEHRDRLAVGSIVELVLPGERSGHEVAGGRFDDVRQDEPLQRRHPGSTRLTEVVLGDDEIWNVVRTRPDDRELRRHQ